MASAASTQVAITQAPKVAAPVAAGVQRQCECGQHTLSADCEDCTRKKMVLQRSANGRFDPPAFPRPQPAAVGKQIAGAVPRGIGGKG